MKKNPVLILPKLNCLQELSLESLYQVALRLLCSNRQKIGKTKYRFDGWIWYSSSSRNPNADHYRIVNSQNPYVHVRTSLLELLNWGFSVMKSSGVSPLRSLKHF